MNWLFKDSDQSTASNKDNLSFTVQQQPSSSLAETNSNLSVVSYKSKSKKEALPAKVRWWKVRNGQSSQLLGVRGSMYPCQPSDLGYKIKAQINSVDEQSKGTAIIWFGPIKIEAGIRQSLHNIISTGHQMFPVFICSGKDSERQGVIKISETYITIVDNKSNNQLKFPFNLAEPRIQLNPRDIYRVCLRFRQQNHEAYLKNFMNESFGLNGSSSQLQDSSQLFRPSNKLQLKFLTRHTRDLITFSLKAFATKRQMVASAIVQKIQRLDLSEQQQFKTFFQFQGLKQQIIRMSNQVQKTKDDRDRKIQDLKNSQDQIVRLTKTYTKIINQKYKDNSELNESISILNNKNNQIQANVKINQLQNQIKQLKNKIRDQFQEIESLKFLRRTNTNNQPDSANSTPFSKKKSQQFILPPDSAVIQLSKQNTKLLEQINRLKKQQREESRLQLHRSKSQIQIQNILQSIGDGKQNETSMINPSFINQSMNESAEIRLLQEKFFQIKQLNQKLLKENQIHIRDIQRRDKQIVSLRKQLLSKPSQSILVPSRSFVNDRQQQFQKLKLQNRLLQSKYEDIVKLKDLKSQVLIETEYYNIKQQHSKCKSKIEQLQTDIKELLKQKEILQPNSSPEVQKYKLINNNLLTEINILKSHLQKNNSQKKAESMHTLNRRIFELQMQLDHFKSSSGKTIDEEISSKLFEAEERIKELEDDVNLKQIKIHTLNGVVEKLMNQVNQRNMSMSLDQSNITARSVGKYKKRILELQDENQMLKRSSNALNKSRDLSMQMEDYKDQMIETIRSEMDIILKQNERLSVMCDRYSRDARQNNKIRQQNTQLKLQLDRIKSS